MNFTKLCVVWFFFLLSNILFDQNVFSLFPTEYLFPFWSVWCPIFLHSQLLIQREFKSKMAGKFLVAAESLANNLEFEKWNNLLHSILKYCTEQDWRVWYSKYLLIIALLRAYHKLARGVDSTMKIKLDKSIPAFWITKHCASCWLSEMLLKQSQDCLTVSVHSLPSFLRSWVS